MGKLKIWSDGLSNHTKISVVDDAGVESPLTMVESLGFVMPSGKQVGTLSLGFCFGNVVEIEVPIDDEMAVGRLKEIGPALRELRAALREVPSGGIAGHGSSWLDRLHRAACAMAGVEVDSTPR